MQRCKVLLCLALAAPTLWAQSSASYQIPRSSVDAGAQGASSVSYQLSGSVGQPDAQTATSPTYRLSGGFQVAIDAGSQSDPIFRDGFE